MRKIYSLIILLAFLGISQLVSGQFYDGFTGTGNIGGNCATVGATPDCAENGWLTHSGTVGTIDIISGSLSYPGLQASTGNKVYITGSSTLTRDVNAAISVAGNVAYYSALIKVIDNTNLSSTGFDYFMCLGASAGNAAISSLGARLGIKSFNSGANFRFGIANTTGGTISYTDCGTDLNFGTTYLVVVKYDKSAAPTVASLWVNPTSFGGTEPTGAVTNSSGTSAFAAFASICIRNGYVTANAGGTPNAEIDEVRVGADWATAVPSGGPVTLVTSITVTGAGNATTITTAAGTLQMSAAILPVDATNQTVTWSITPASGIASINSSGLLTAIADGVVTVKATANDGSGVFGTLDITISNQPAFIAVTSITVTGAGNATTISTAAGTLQMSAAILPVDATNQTVTWSVTPAIATINTSGLLTASGNGVATVKATANDGSNVFGTLDITISNQPTATGSYRNLPIYRYFNAVAPDSVNSLDSTDITYGGWSVKSVTGTANWAVKHYTTNYYAGCNGFNLGATESWFISPGFTIPSGSDVNLKFSSCQKFAGNPIQVLVSTNYDGVGLPATAIWTDITGSTLPPTNLAGPRVWKNSGDVSLSTYVGTYVCVAFKYTCDAANATDWELDSLSIMNSTGIYHFSNASSIAIYPNPAKESVTIANISNASRIEVSNILGQIVSSVAKLPKNELSIDISKFNKGIYFVTVYDNESIVKTVKFIKE